MKLSDIQSQLGSDEQKNNNNKKWCEDCNKDITERTRHFQSEKHIQLILKNQNQTGSKIKITSRLSVKYK